MPLASSASSVSTTAQKPIIVISISYRFQTSLAQYNLCFTLNLLSLFLNFISILYMANNCKSRIILSQTWKISAANSGGRDAKCRHFVSNVGKKGEIVAGVCKTSQIFFKPRASFFLTRTTPPWYNIQGGLGDNLIFVLASARISKFTTVSHASAQNYFIILLLFGAPAGSKTGFWRGLRWF